HSGIGKAGFFAGLFGSVVKKDGYYFYTGEPDLNTITVVDSHGRLKWRHRRQPPAQGSKIFRVQVFDGGN
ncbi:MAG TPA: hypothetical protein VIH99_03230, partial [Bdellovibrionota bacterium]